ncbi:SPOR domain-containing protein [Thauera butanivorans]|uniref:SPOR domain-containing protein n=1 Tax=Thauera butanivorans TaxID=86174 RepID=UPI0008392F84|nr:SPOR domain-containing protein [Thauera butanivorans]
MTAARRSQRNAALRMAGAALLAAVAALIAALSLEQRLPGDGARPMPDAVAPAPSLGSGLFAPMEAGIAAAGDSAAVRGAAPEPAQTPEETAMSVPSPASSPAAEAAEPIFADAPPAPADGYRIQLGVFGDPANALALQRALAAQGLQAGIQSRVVLGPFADREAAQKAQAALRAAGAEAGMLLAPEKKRR